jgi:hypothetical protein
MNPRINKIDQLVLHPFPQQVFGSTDRAEVWRRYRENMISYAGISIFLFGNKMQNGAVIKSNGMKQEFDIARVNGAILLPVGATGYMSEDLWIEARTDVQTRFSNKPNILELYEKLGDKNASPEQLIEIIIDLLGQIQK